MLLVLLCVRATVALSYATAAKPAPVQGLTKIAIVDSPSKASRRSNYLRSSSAGASTPPPAQLHINTPVSVSPVM
jgi:hypothetical protein